MLRNSAHVTVLLAVCTVTAVGTAAAKPPIGIVGLDGRTTALEVRQPA